MTFADSLLCDPVRRTHPTKAASDASLESEEDRFAERREGWSKMIDRYLVEWGRDPALLEDEDFEPPALDTISRAIEVAQNAAERGLPPPLRVLPDGDGGIVFERSEGTVFESIKVREDGSVHLLSYRGNELRAKQRIEL